MPQPQVGAHIVLNDGEGADIRPWTVTHTDRGSRYVQYADEARAAAAFHGESAAGNFVGPSNYHDAVVPAASPGLDAPVDPPVAGPPPDFSPPTDPDATGSVERFLEAALAQEGDDYVFNAHTDPNDPDPDAFDCSELVEWAAAQTGVKMGEASFYQYLELKNANHLMSVEDAMNTPGALLFSFSTEPVPGGGRPEKAHVAISLGDGRTIEAMGTNYGVRQADAEGRFNYAGLIPGMDYSEYVDVDALLNPTEPAFSPMPDPNAHLDAAALNEGGVDTDVDMLPDHFEVKYGLDPEEPDSDGDGITDGYELIMIGSRPDIADSDFDQLSDGIELLLGLDPTVADNPDPSAGLMPSEDLLLDSDGDGLSDWGEVLAGTDFRNPDTDGDMVLDGDEFMAGSDALSADA